MLEVKDLKVNYGEVKALKGVEMEVKEGQVVAVIGANGGGKTTLMKALMGLLPARGSINYMGKNIRKLKCHERVGLGISLVPEGRQVFPQMTVLDNLTIGAFSQRKKTQDFNDELDRILDLFPALKPRLKQSAGSLSGGEQQMLAIGRGLMSKPQLLLLDEPGMGLAPIIIQSLRDVILTIAKTKTTVLLAEQNASLALKIADYVYLLQVGEIVLEGTPEKLKDEELVKKAYFGG